MDELTLKNATNCDEVHSMLAKNEKNDPVNTINNFVTIFENDVNLRDCLRFNEISNAPENAKTQKNWSDADSSAVKCYIERIYHLYSAKYDDAFNIVYTKNSYNPVKQIIEAVTWDGKKRIASILQKYLKCEDSEYTSEVARILFSGGIKRLYEPGSKFDYMVIFRGAQGCGKSTFVRWLAIHDNYFKEVTQINGQEGKEALDGVWVGEVSELLALTKNKDEEMVKSFIARQNDAYRRPYAKFTTSNYRKCILVGTTNKSQFLRDKTGERRYLPIKTHSCGRDLFNAEKECRADILQCWAEAKHYYDTGEYSLVTKEWLENEIQKQRDEVTEDDWRVGVIENYLSKKDKVCVKMIWDEALAKETNRDCTKKDSSDIVEIMNTFNDWERVNLMRFAAYGQQRGWRKIAPKTIEDLKPIEDNGELPF